MPITQSQIDAVNTATFRFAEDVDNWCTAVLGGHFLAWFNANLANKGPWVKVSVVDTVQNRVGFHAFWNNISDLTGATATPFQFLALMGIFANETAANFMPQAELIGLAGFPGLSYPFDAIPKVKRSYNTLPENKTAFACFRSPAFKAAHAGKAMEASVVDTTDIRWNLAVYPRPAFPTDAKPAVTGYIQEADFMKFRGRGFIQTTNRAGYKALIQFVQAYTGDNGTLDFYAARWAGQPVDDVADASSNEDWNRLFQQSDLILAANAIRLHNAGNGNYLKLAGDPDAAITNMGRRISGSPDYAKKYRDRMQVLFDLLD